MLLSSVKRQLIGPIFDGVTVCSNYRLKFETADFKDERRYKRPMSIIFLTEVSKTGNPKFCNYLTLHTKLPKAFNRTNI